MFCVDTREQFNYTFRLVPHQNSGYKRNIVVSIVFTFLILVSNRGTTSFYKIDLLVKPLERVVSLVALDSLTS